jgi:glutamate synthase (NADPH/NADH) large chain
MAMVAIGCTICRQCNLGTCHVGICTQIKNSEEAEQKGLKHFTPLQFGTAVERLLRLFKGLSEEIRALTAQLGSNRLQDLVGRADLLEQIAFKDSIDLSPMFEPMPIKPRPQLEPGVGILLIRPRNSLTSILTDLVMDTLNDDEREVTYQDTVMAIDRALGTRLAGEMIRNPQVKSSLDCVHLRLGPSSVAGNGFAAWLTDKVDILIEGGAQDGVAKGACGGRVAVMKGVNNNGMRVDGSVGKSFAYAAQSGSFIVQGNADSRACVRLCGADVVLGGEITAPVDDAFGSLGSQSNLKGFACEYMTAGHVLIMGDPGPYAFSGMTGGTVYQKLTPEFGFDEKALRRRFARGASVAIHTLDASDINKIRAMLTAYIEALEQTYQSESAEHIRSMLEEAYLKHYFIKVKPINQ